MVTLLMNESVGHSQKRHQIATGVFQNYFKNDPLISISFLDRKQNYNACKYKNRFQTTVGTEIPMWVPVLQFRSLAKTGHRDNRVT